MVRLFSICVVTELSSRLEDLDRRAQVMRGYAFAGNTWKTRRSQWKKYLQFCESISSPPVPADVTLICRYIVFLSESLKYVSIVNYISAVVVLHKLLGYEHTFRSDYIVKFTFMGLRRFLGDPAPNRPTLLVSQLLYITAPNTMICCTVYTKRVRKNNTSTYTNLSLKHCIVKCALYQHYAVFEY